MKKAIAVICTICLVFFCVSCQSKGVMLNTEKSFFSDYEIENNNVFIYCTLFIYNPSEFQIDVKIEASFEKDVKNGLLKEAVVTGYSVDKTIETFNLQKGENQIDVVFIGDYAGVSKKSDRLLPDIEIIEID